MPGRYRAIAEYYDAEYEPLRMLAEDVPFFLSRCGKKPLSILELAVGTGRAAIPLAEAGHRVVGVDYAPEMLAIARRKRDAVGLTGDDLELERQDLLKLNLPSRFDRACIFFNTFLAFTTLAEQDRLLRHVAAHLRRRGRLWSDIFNPDLALLAHYRRQDTEPVQFFVPEFDRSVMKTASLRRGKTPQLQHVTFNYRWHDITGQEHRQKRSFDLTWMTPRELRLLLERHNFEIEAMYGNYDGSGVDPDSPRLIADCRLK